MSKILWIDDEQDLLKPYFLYLQDKGYEVESASNGQDAIEMCANSIYDIIFLDENMPGLSGLETLARIKDIRPSIPVVMITKNEEEDIMDMAIGNKIADYLLKPVNPKQIILTLKKHIHQKDIISDQTTNTYRQEFPKIGMQIDECRTADDWKALYKRLLHWEMELDETDNDMKEILQMQKSEGNNAFAKFVAKSYEGWIASADRPMMSHDIMKKVVFPMLDNGDKVFMIVIDNFRYDQWLSIRDDVAEYFTIDSEDAYFSILPTATQYARNAIFSGLTPAQIQELYPQYWVDEEEDEGKNMKEEELLDTVVERFRKKFSQSYAKINSSDFGENLIRRIDELGGNELNVCVMNFVDMLSHAKTDSKMMRELVKDESAYRSLTQSWFRHSSAKALFKAIASKGYKVVLTTDHGTIRVKNPIKVVGDKATNVNLRYKVGKNLGYSKKEVLEMLQPKKVGLTSPNISSAYIFATGDDFFAYPNNYNYYVSYYKDTFQHGGVSMEEMIVPLVVMSPKQ